MESCFSRLSLFCWAQALSVGLGERECVCDLSNPLFYVRCCSCAVCLLSVCGERYRVIACLTTLCRMEKQDAYYKDELKELRLKEVKRLEMKKKGSRSRYAFFMCALNTGVFVKKYKMFLVVRTTRHKRERHYDDDRFFLEFLFVFDLDCCGSCVWNGLRGLHILAGTVVCHCSTVNRRTHW